MLRCGSTASPSRDSAIRDGKCLEGPRWTATQQDAIPEKRKRRVDPPFSVAARSPATSGRRRKPVFSGLRRWGLLRLARGRLDHLASLDAPGADALAHDAGAVHGADVLEVGEKPAAISPGDTTADTAFLFGNTSARDLITDARPLAADFANFRHGISLEIGAEKIAVRPAAVNGRGWFGRPTRAVQPMAESGRGASRRPRCCYDPKISPSVLRALSEKESPSMTSCSGGFLRSRALSKMSLNFCEHSFA